MGLHRFSYTLVPHFGPYHYAGIVSAAYAFNAPVHHAFLEPRAGEAGALPALVACEDRNIVVEAVKKAEDSSDIVVRVYECHNSRGHAELFSARKPTSAVLCDLEENEIGELELAQGLVAFDYKPFEIITIKLKF
jgi:alpha-mannosidase